VGLPLCPVLSACWACAVYVPSASAEATADDVQLNGVTVAGAAVGEASSAPPTDEPAKTLTVTVLVFADTPPKVGVVLVVTNVSGLAACSATPFSCRIVSWA